MFGELTMNLLERAPPTGKELLLMLLDKQWNDKEYILHEAKEFFNDELPTSNIIDIVDYIDFKNVFTEDEVVTMYMQQFDAKHNVSGKCITKQQFQHAFQIYFLRFHYYDEFRKNNDLQTWISAQENQLIADLKYSQTLMLKEMPLDQKVIDKKIEMYQNERKAALASVKSNKRTRRDIIRQLRREQINRDTDTFIPLNTKAKKLEVTQLDDNTTCPSPIPASNDHY